MKQLFSLIAAITLAAGCGNGSVDKGSSEIAATADAAATSAKTGDGYADTSKPQPPVTISYQIIGTPIVGQPLAIDLQVQSRLGPQEIVLSYRINDTTAMQFMEAQPARVTIAPTNAVEPSLQQIRVVPLREGRLFLNVSASVMGEEALLSSVTAIPIQVGAAPRVIQENGELGTDENGELIRSLPATE
jgi:hypothetical protein